MKPTKRIHPNFHVRPWTRHSLVLLIAGITYILIGIGYLYITPGGPRDIGLVVAKNVMPLKMWACVWMLVGASAVISSRWPAVAETWGYMFLTGLAAGWGATYLTGVIFVGTPWSNISAAVTWGMVAFMWWAISGLVSPDRVVVLEHGRD